MSERLRPKSQMAARAELGRVRRALTLPDLLPDELSELYGAQQALCWATGENAMPPAQCATLSWKHRRAVNDERKRREAKR